MHTRPNPQAAYQPFGLNPHFARVPILGEWFVLQVGEAHYQVDLVVHLAYANAESYAEVFATERSDPLPPAVRNMPEERGVGK